MERTPPTDTPRRVSFVTLALITAALYFGRDVLIPLALAILISFILTPSVQRLQQMRLGRVPAVLAVVVVVFGAVAAMTWIMGRQLGIQWLWRFLGRQLRWIVGRIERFRRLLG